MARGKHLPKGKTGGLGGRWEKIVNRHPGKFAEGRPEDAFHRLVHLEHLASEVEKDDTVVDRVERHLPLVRRDLTASSALRAGVMPGPWRSLSPQRIQRHALKLEIAAA